MTKIKIFQSLMAMSLCFMFILIAVSCNQAAEDRDSSAVSSSKSVINNEYIDKYSMKLDNKNSVKISCKTGEVITKIMSVTPVHNFNDIGINTDDLLENFYGVYAYSMEPEGKRESFGYSDCFDSSTGELNESYCFFYVEYELRSIGAVGMGISGLDDCSGDNMFPVNRCNPMFSMAGTSYNSSQVVYFEEYGRDDSDYPLTVRLNKGETVTVHLGFILRDTYTPQFANVGFNIYNSGNYSEDCHREELMENRISFDISKEVAACKGE